MLKFFIYWSKDADILRMHNGEWVPAQTQQKQCIIIPDSLFNTLEWSFYVNSVYSVHYFLSYWIIKIL